MSQSFCVERVRCDSWRDKTQGGAVYYKGVWGAAILEQLCAREDSIRMSDQSILAMSLTKDERFTRPRTGLGTFRAIGIY